MENISHTLAGLAMAEVIHRVLPAESDDSRQTTRRRLLLTAGGVASNFPDLDLIFVRLLPKPLGYLLHHRGHTHTLFYLIPQGFLVLLALWLLWPSARRLFSTSSATRRGLLLSIFGGLCLHLLMDTLNSYGIHPFYPLNPNWLYGDMVFIVEPLFWIAFGIPLLMSLNQKYSKILSAGLLLALPTFFTLKGYFVWTSLAVLYGVAGALALTYRRSAPLRSIFGGFAVVSAFLLLAGLGSRNAKKAISASTNAAFLDAAVHSYPTNPFCWMFVSIAKDEARGIYSLKRGKVSTWPAVIPVDQCPDALVEVQKIDSDQIATSETFEGNLAQLRTLAQTDCQFQAWLRFARMPLVTGTDAHDVRFSSQGRPDFSTLQMDDGKRAECPSGIPNWGRPREDLL